MEHTVVCVESLISVLKLTQVPRLITRMISADFETSFDQTSFTPNIAMDSGERQGINCSKTTTLHNTKLSIYFTVQT